MQIKVGVVLCCTVQSTTDYGAWVRVPGLSYPGLVLLPDISWGRPPDPAAFFSIGGSHDMIVLRHDTENRRLSLGLKQLQPDPWSLLQERLVPGEPFAPAAVVQVTDYGAFVALAEHVEALLYIAQMKAVAPLLRHPSDMVRVGDNLAVVVRSVDLGGRKIRVDLDEDNAIGLNRPA